ncbi:putative cyclic nucleotide-gated ion channel 7 [Spatholobus suberectus]|nr:putative cyclic nucleotide-gated ion channel 7 [Spatholobus suberectus]
MEASLQEKDCRTTQEEEELCDSDYEKGDDSARALVERTGTYFSSSLGLGTTIYTSRFAANALRAHRLHGSSSRDMIRLQKPPEPDFSDLDEN